MKLDTNQLLFRFVPTLLDRYKVRATSHEQVIESAAEYDLRSADAGVDGGGERLEKCVAGLAEILKDPKLSPLLHHLLGSELPAAKSPPVPVLLFEVPAPDKSGIGDLVLRWDLACWVGQPLWRHAAVAWLPRRSPGRVLPEPEPRYDGSDKLRAMSIGAGIGDESLAARTLPQGGTREQAIADPGQSPLRRSALEWLLRDLFDAPRMRQLAHGLNPELNHRLPGGTAPLDQLASELAKALNDVGWLGRAFDDILTKVPRRSQDINAVRAVSALESLLSAQSPASGGADLPHFIHFNFPSATPPADASKLRFPGGIQVGAEHLALALRTSVDVVAFSAGDLLPGFGFALLEEAPRCVVLGAGAPSGNYLMAYVEKLAQLDWLQAHWAACGQAATAAKDFLPPTLYLKLPRVWRSIEPRRRLRERLDEHLAELARAGSRPGPLIHARIQLLKDQLLETAPAPLLPAGAKRRRVKRVAPPR